MKKIFSLLLVVFLWLGYTFVSATWWGLNKDWCHNSKTYWYHCHNEVDKEEVAEEKIDSKLQKKIDKINKKIELIYNKKPKTIIWLQVKIKKILPKIQEGSTKYILIAAIDKKITELINKDNSSENKEKKSYSTIENKWNTTIDSFSKSKKLLENNVYNLYNIKRNTFYCGCDYSSDKYVNKESCGFQDNWKYVSRSKKIEWEHVVPAEAFGNSFVEWREWHEECIDSKWETFKWRNCASKVNMEYRYMQSDMYNLVPAIGSINALRSNYSFSIISWEDRDFWSCDMEIKDRKAEPSDNIKWDIARIYMYMHTVYPGRWIIWNKNEKLFKAWNESDPVSNEECDRYKYIKQIQWNDNPILANLCNK